MKSRIAAGQGPSLLVLRYDRAGQVIDLLAIPRRFVTDSILTERKPLAPTAKRAGWIGSTIRIQSVPEEARVFIVQGGVPSAPTPVIERFRRAEGLSALPALTRRWTLVTLDLIRKLGSDFSLQDVYKLETVFSEAFPRNRNTRAKIRQQLQILRDLGFIKFEGSGHYSRLP